MPLATGVARETPMPVPAGRIVAFNGDAIAKMNPRGRFERTANAYEIFIAD